MKRPSAKFCLMETCQSARLGIIFSVVFSVAFSLGISLGASTSAAYTFSEVEYFGRCYALLTGRPVPLAHPLRKKVQSKTVTGLDACNSILEKGRLKPDGTLLYANDSESIYVLNRFYQFHRTWFPINNAEKLTDFNVDFGGNTEDVFDITEPALALTRVLFADHKYREALTTLPGVRGIREKRGLINSEYDEYFGGFTSPSRRAYVDNLAWNDNVFGFRSLGESDAPSINATLLSAPKIGVGDLVGIVLNDDQLTVPNITLFPNALELPEETRGPSATNLVYSYDILKPFGAGVLGSQVFLLSYIGHGLRVKIDGALKVQRRWSQQALQTFLCANLPTLLKTDVTSYLSNSETAPPFRSSTNCLACHATLDPMAYPLRNMTLGSSDMRRPGSPFKATMLMAQFKADHPAINEWSPEAVEDFNQQAPKGRFFYRSVTGKLIDVAVNNLNELGETLVSTDDYYQCAAAHYVEQLTGIRVPLYNRQDPRFSELNQGLSSDDVRDRKFVETLGTRLKQTQSLFDLVQEIIRSPYFREADFRP